MKAISIGKRYEIYDDSLKAYDRLPAKTYTVRFEKMSGFFLEVTDKGRKSITHSYPISRGEFDDDERNVNTDEIIGNIFDRPKMLKYRR